MAERGFFVSGDRLCFARRLRMLLERRHAATTLLAALPTVPAERTPLVFDVSRISGRQLAAITAGLLAAGLLLLGIGIAAFATGHSDSAPAPSTTEIEPATASAQAVTSPATSSAWASGSPSLPSVSATAPVAPSRQGKVPSASPYQGLGSWIDIYEDRAWKNPAATVADMKRHGVRTIYLETGNSRSPGDIFKSAKAQQFIDAAHANDMKIVAWYLPDLKDVPRDFARIQKAIQLTTPSGEKFDSFALDIESGAVKTVSKRNAALMTLSRQIRDSVGPSYPLGAIIPSPVGLSRKGSYWGSFPYTELAGVYDAFVPMSYYTYHGDGAKAARADTLGNMRILRAQKGCATTPVHLIGGIAEETSAAELKAFLQAARESGAVGASFYSWTGTNSAHWAEMQSALSWP